MAEEGPNAIVGTKHSGFLRGSKIGPCECCRCIHSAEEDNYRLCAHPDVIEDAKAGELPLLKGKGVVDNLDYCDYFNPGPDVLLREITVSPFAMPRPPML